MSEHRRTIRRPLQWFGSLQVAVPLLMTIALVLAWGTIYEARFGTAAVQHFFYRSWWFQAILGFLAVNLAIAAWQRYPWKRQHAPFVLAHVGIICILIGGIIGGRWGIEGQLIIPEGQSERLLQLPTNVLVVHEAGAGSHAEFPTRFEATAWEHQPRARYRVPLAGRAVTLTVDTYYPDAVTEEDVTDDNPHDSPGLQVALRHGPQSPMAQEERFWLLARDPERFGLRWGAVHLLFLEPENEAQLAQLLGRGDAPKHPRGEVTIRFEKTGRTHTVPVPERMGQPIAIEGTPYLVTVKEYFSDFTLTEQGPANRSDQPNNPAVALTLSGPEGIDAHLLFALHPDFAALHGRSHLIPAEVRYTHAAASSLPPNSIAFIQRDAATLGVVFVGDAGQQKQVDAVAVGQRHRHPWLDYDIELVGRLPRARLTQRFINRSNDVRGEALHVVAEDGAVRDDAWLGLRGSAQLALEPQPVTVEYRPATRELPVVIKLLDFRKIDYPGTQMAAGFEADVQLSDPERGLILVRKISMNNPLRYRNFSFYQSSFIPGDVETTVLSVRSDPGTPLVYAGFLIVIAGVSSLFVTRRKAARPRKGART